MREIKFRVWCKNRNEWEKDAVALLPNGSLKELRTHRPLSNESHIVLFATGLHDKNGKEIYEGDILKSFDPSGEEDRTFAVDYDKSAGGYVFEALAGFDDFDVTTIPWAKDMGFEFEIIGNIYENPELLEAP